MTSIDRTARARRRGGPARCVVTRVERPTPRTVRVSVQSDGFVGLPATGPDQRVKLAFPDGRTFGDDPAEAGRARRRRRTYTLLDLDSESGTADIEFVVHGGGLAGSWAERAAPGDELDITGPVGTFAADDCAELVLVCDETGLPALLAIVAGLGAAAPAVRAFVEVHDEAEVRALPGAVDAHWLLRSAHPGAAPGDLVASLAGALTCAPGSRAWIAGEAAAVRALRAHVLAHLGLERSRVSAVAYWTRGHAEGDPAAGRPGEHGETVG